jgi:hypothetical protein
MAHIIVVGNEKGGSGKSTTCMHVATALSRLGKRVGAIDLDLRQKSFGRYIENRRAYSWHRAVLTCPPRIIATCQAQSGTDAGQDQRLTSVVEALHAEKDFIVIDCPGSHTRLSQLAHTMADTLITPMNDSFVDFDLLARVDPMTEPGQGPLDLCRNGLGGPPDARPGRAEADRLDRGQQPPWRPGDAQQEEGRCGAGGPVAPHRVSCSCGVLGTGDLPRAVPARPDLA